MKAAHLLSSRRARQAGFTLVEMMVALAISMVVLLGFSVMFVNIKRTFISQDQSSQLQDNERLAMTVLTAASQEAGYYPTPATLDASQIVASSLSPYGDMIAGQAITGAVASGTTSDSLSLAFAASANDGLITCQGHTVVAADITAAGATLVAVGVRNIFYVDKTAKTLNCVVMVNGSTTATGAGTTQPLITNVQDMSLLYGVDGGGGSVAGYWPASGVSNWSAVKSVRVTLTFVNPNDSANPIPWVQTINVLNH